MAEPDFLRLMPEQMLQANLSPATTPNPKLEEETAPAPPPLAIDTELLQPTTPLPQAKIEPLSPNRDISKVDTAQISVFELFGLPKPSGFVDVALESIAGSGLFGGLPYLALALWARRWMRGRSEREIQRLMLVAPVLMTSTFAVFCLAMGLFSARMSIWLRIAWEFSPLILILGYAYVALTVLLRATLVKRHGGIAPAHPQAL